MEEKTEIFCNSREILPLPPFVLYIFSFSRLFLRFFFFFVRIRSSDSQYLFLDEIAFFFFEDLLHFSDSSLSFSLVIHRYFLSFQRRNVRINVRPCEISRPPVVIFHLSPFIFHVSCSLSLSLSRVKYSRQGVLILPSFSFSFFPPFLFPFPSLFFGTLISTVSFVDF